MSLPVTFICTSSNRFDLLQQTLNSFLRLNAYPITQYIINEDSGNLHCYQKIVSRYGSQFQLLLNPGRQGQSTAIDNLLRLVNTEYVFHCEDDWLFNGTNQHFIAQSLQVLQHNPHIHQVWVRHAADHTHPLGAIQQINGVACQPVLRGYQTHWSGFSHNPGLRRLSNLRYMFPHGLRQFGDEIECSKHANTFNYTAVALADSCVQHIGNGRHTQGYKV